MYWIWIKCHKWVSILTCTINLSLDEVNLCKKNKDVTNQLIFGIILCHFTQNLQFQSHKDQANNLPMQLLLQVAKYLGINLAYTDSFYWNTRSAERHHQDIKEYLDYRIAGTEDIARVINYLADNLLLHHLSDAVLLEQARTYLAVNKMEIPSIKQLKDCIYLAGQKFEQQFLGKIFNNLT